MVKESDTASVPTIVSKTQEVPEYVNETVQQVETESKENLESFINSREIRDAVASSVMDASKLAVLSNLRPDLEEKIEELVPDYSDFKRGAPPDDYNYAVRILKWEKDGYNESAQREVQKEKQRKTFFREIFEPLNTLETAKGDWINLNKFGQMVKNERYRISDELIRYAKEEALNSDIEGQCIVVSLRSTTLKDFIDSGNYRAALDNEKITISDWKDAVEASKSKNNEDIKYHGMHKKQIRAAREMELGIYDNNEGGPHPVYAEMVADPEKELSRLEERGYGDIQLKFKLSRIKERTVFATGDTVAERKYNHQLAWAEAAKARVFLNSLEQKKYVDRRQYPEYVEAHIMGGVTLEDIDECIINPNEENKKLIEKFKSNPDNFKISHEDEDKIVVKFLY